MPDPPTEWPFMCAECLKPLTPRGTGPGLECPSCEDVWVLRRRTPDIECRMGSGSSVSGVRSAALLRPGNKPASGCGARW